jgi:hypothetical protein
VLTGASVCVRVADMLVFSMGEFLTSAGIGSFRYRVDGATPSDESEDASNGAVAGVSGGSSSVAPCGTASSRRVSRW